MVLRPSLKRGVPGSVPPWRAPCFAWPCRGFGSPGFFLWHCHGFLLLTARNRGRAVGVAAKAASRSAQASSSGFAEKKTHGCKSLLLQLFQVETRSSGRRQGQETNRPAARGLLRFPYRSVFLRFALSRCAARRSFC